MNVNSRLKQHGYVLVFLWGNQMSQKVELLSPKRRGNMQLMLKNGRVIMAFDQPVRNMSLTRQEAVDLAQAMFSLAQQIPVIYVEEPKKVN